VQVAHISIEGIGMPSAGFFEGQQCHSFTTWQRVIIALLPHAAKLKLLLSS
jgi:hypothetical protein